MTEPLRSKLALKAGAFLIFGGGEVLYTLLNSSHRPLGRVRTRYLSPPAALSAQHISVPRVVMVLELLLHPSQSILHRLLVVLNGRSRPAVRILAPRLQQKKTKIITNPPLPTHSCSVRLDPSSCRSSRSRPPAGREQELRHLHEAATAPKTSAGSPTIGRHSTSRA